VKYKIMDPLARQLQREAQTSADAVATSSVRIWIHYIRLNPPLLSTQDPEPLDWWLQSIINRHPTTVPKTLILPRLLNLYKRTT
jgi:hypothetical protein